MSRAAMFALLPVLTAPLAAGANDFVDTRLTWTFGDDDVVASTADRAPPSPRPRIGDRPGYELFFDNLDTRYTGRENLAHLVLYKKLPGFLPGVTTEAALVGVWIPGVTIDDDGSFVRIAWAPRADRPDDGLSLTLYPFSTNRFQLGYLYDLAWGGDDLFSNAIGPAPGAKAQYDLAIGHYFVGLKTASIRVPVETGVAAESQYAVLAGAGWDFTPMLRVDLGGGYFQQGNFDIAGVRGLAAYTVGGSARVVLHDGIDVGTSVDLQLYRNDPDVPYTFGNRETYVPGRFSWAVSVEGTVLEQNLADPDVAGETVLQPAFASAVQWRFKLGYLRGSVIGLWRNVEYILRNVPSFVPFEGITDQATTTSELFGAVTFDYNFPVAHVTVGVMGGVLAPATFGSTVTEDGLEVSRTLVVRQRGDVDILPPGEDAVPVVAARASVKWELSDILSSYLFTQYVHDPNGTRLVADPGGGTRRIFQSFHRLGMGLTVQARF